MARGSARRALPVGEALRALARALGMEGRLQEIDIRRIWPVAVGRSVAEHAQPVRLEGGRLLVQVSDSAWLHRLSLRRRDLARDVNQHLDRAVVKDVRFRIGVLAEACGGAPPHPPRPPTPDPRSPLRDPALRQALDPIRGLPFEHVVERILRRQQAGARLH
jgi:hypothetical protein